MADFNRRQGFFINQNNKRSNKMEKIKMIKAKKGFGHVEVIISFVLFLSFIVFLLIFLNPIKKLSSNPAYLGLAEEKILGRISTNLTSFSLTLNSTLAVGNGECIFFPFISPDYSPTAKLIVKSESGDITGASRTDSYVYFNYTYRKRFYKMYFSNELSEKGLDTSNCRQLTEADYKIGVIQVEKVVSLPKLAGLKDSYINDYNSFKLNLGLKSNLNLIAVNSTGDLLRLEKFKPRTEDIMAREVPIKILDENANLNPAVLNIQVWD